jgi:DtxR family Mn-dependent transcriptional regulator
MMDHPWHEELLEHVFTQREEGSRLPKAVLASTPGRPGPERLLELERLGFVKLDEGHVDLTLEGERIAREVVRRHRLSERLLRDVLALAEPAAEETACELEHVFSPAATGALCAFLGHPRSCPHGKPIPPGPCCQARAPSGVIALADAELGVPAHIVFLAPRGRDRLARLAALGVTPGSTVRLVQRRPSAVVEVGETLLALDPQIAADVYVECARRIDAGTAPAPR